MKKLIGLFLFSLLLFPSSYGQENPEASEKVRLETATKNLKENVDIAAVYVKGLCCHSCAIGVRKKIGKLKAIDTKRLKKGVDLDTKTQLATFALKKGAVVDPKALAKAVKDAGYEPVRIYQIENGKVTVTEIKGER